MINKVVGNYHILEKIGEGGMGVVYQGIDLMLDRPVAVKVLRSNLMLEEEIVERFRREAKALARLNHPNVASLYSLLHQDDQYLMVMELVTGANLEQKIKQHGKLSYSRVREIFGQIVSGVGSAHKQNIIHRDLKPSNIMENDEGIIKVMDFGIARIAGVSPLTEAGRALGSLYYSSPEQIRADLELDRRTDIYSLGIILFQMLTGELPFTSNSYYGLAQKHIEELPPLIRERVPQVSDAIEAVVARALAKNPNDRFDSVEEFYQALPETFDGVGAVQVSDSAKLRQQNLQAEINRRLVQQESLPVAEETLFNARGEVEEVKVKPIEEELDDATDFNLTNPLIAPLPNETSTNVFHQNEPFSSSDQKKFQNANELQNIETIETREASAETKSEDEKLGEAAPLASSKDLSTGAKPHQRRYIAVVGGIAILSLLIVLAAAAIGFRAYSQRTIKPTGISDEVPQEDSARTEPTPSEPTPSEQPDSTHNAEQSGTSKNAASEQNSEQQNVNQLNDDEESDETKADNKDKTVKGDKKPKSTQTVVNDDEKRNDAPASTIKTPKQPTGKQNVAPAITKPTVTRKPIQTPTIAP